MTRTRPPQNVAASRALMVKVLALVAEVAFEEVAFEGVSEPAPCTLAQLNCMSQRGKSAASTIELNVWGGKKPTLERGFSRPRRMAAAPRLTL
jgi:hypothetical protein